MIARRGLLAAAVVAVPASAQEPPPAIAGRTWILREIGGELAPAQPAVSLLFAPEGRAVGSGGCNRFTGGARIEGSTLALGPLASTRMACAPPQGPQEDRYLQALNAVRRYEIVEGRLHLLDANGAVLAVFAR